MPQQEQEHTDSAPKEEGPVDVEAVLGFRGDAAEDEEELRQELAAIEQKLQAMKSTITNADELLSMMVEEYDAVAERITKLHTLRKARPAKMAQL